MSCRYYLYCKKCDVDSGEVNTNDVMEVKRIVQLVERYSDIIQKLLDHEIELSHCSVQINTIFCFLKIHWKCEFFIMNEWSDIETMENVTKHFGFGEKGFENIKK